MTRFRLSLLTASILTASLSGSVQAAAFQFYELCTPIIGTAAVGQAAMAEDASTAYFNPAGMGLLQKSAFLLGAQMLVPNINFSKSPATTITGDNGGQAGSLTPGMDLYFAYSYSPKLKFGLSVTTPYGGELSYTDGWVGRYIVQNALFYTINVNPSVAYRLNNWLSLGAGFSIEYLNLQQTSALSLIPLIDGQVNIKMTNVAPGANVGIMLTPTASTKVGLAYRSRITHNLHGNATFLRLALTPNTSTKMVMPQNIIVSIAQALTPNFTLLGELGWSNWSSMQNTVVNVAGFTAITPEKWHDTYRLGLAGQYKVKPDLLLQAGASFDSSPTSSSHRLPVLPMDKQVRVGAGLMYTLLKAVTIGASYEYINFGNASINNTSSAGVLAGSYSRNFANTLQVSVNVEA